MPLLRLRQFAEPDDRYLVDVELQHGTLRRSATLKETGRLADARQYAEAALRDFQTYGPGAADQVQKTLALISRIAKAATA